MKYLIPQKILMFILLSFLSHPALAKNIPELCSFSISDTLYRESSVFVTVPSNIGGCMGVIPGAIIGGIMGVPFGDPEMGASFGAVISDYVFQGIFGFPFYIIEYIPRKIIESSNKDSIEEDKNNALPEN